MTARPQLPISVIALAILVVAASTQPVFLLGAAYLEIGPELGFGPTGLGLLTAGFFLTASVVSAPLGRVVERIGWRRAMRINMAGSATIALALAVFGRSTEIFALFLVAAGIFYGLANPAANEALAERVPPRRLALVFGLKHGGIPSSTLIAGLAVPLIIVSFGWRAAYLVAAVLAAGVFLSIPSSRGTAPAVAGDPDPRRKVAPLRGHVLVWMAAASALASWAAIALATFLVAAAVDRGFAASVAGVMLFAGSFVSISARISYGALSDRIGATGFGAVAALMAIGAVVFATLPVSSGAGFVLLVLAAFASGWAWPGLMTYTVVNANTDSAASSSAITQAGVFVGAGAGPVIIGWVVDRHGFDAAWLTVAAALVAAAIVMNLAGRAARANS